MNTIIERAKAQVERNRVRNPFDFYIYSSSILGLLCMALATLWGLAVGWLVWIGLMATIVLLRGRAKKQYDVAAKVLKKARVPEHEIPDFWLATTC